MRESKKNVVSVNKKASSKNDKAFNLVARGRIELPTFGL
jgi:hypothetical protein